MTRSITQHNLRQRLRRLTRELNEFSETLAQLPAPSTAQERRRRTILVRCIRSRAKRIAELVERPVAPDTPIG